MTDNKALVPVPQRVETALVSREDELRVILGDAIPVKRFIKTAVVAIAKNPDLQKCTFDSLVISVMEAAQVGIEPTGSLSRGWLVPFSDKGITKAQLIIGWMGLIDLAKDSGEVAKITARVVYEGDEFIVEQGTVDRITHVPHYQTEDPTKITHAYMVATMKDGTTVHEVMTKAQIDAVRAIAKAKNGPAWTNNYAEMARKTVVRRGVKYLHLTPKARQAIERDDEREFGDFSAPPAAPTAKVQSLKEALKEQATVVVEIDGEAVEVEADRILNPDEVAEGAPVYLAPQKVEAQAEEAAAPATDGAGGGQPEVTPPPPPAASADPRTNGRCGAVSPYGTGALCDRQGGHPGSHMSGTGKDREAW